MSNYPIYSYCQGNIIPLHPSTKRPMDDAWTLIDTPIKTDDDLLAFLSLGYNVGFRIPEGHMVIDVDPRNRGDISYYDLPQSVKDLPITTFTPSGGWHIYCKLPPSVDAIKLKSKHDSYPGIDFLKRGKQVVLPGSTLLDGELQYKLNDHAVFPPPECPRELIELLERRMNGNSNTTTVPSGYLDSHDLYKILKDIPVSAYRDNDSWLSLLFACHHATAGVGLDVFISWSVSDPLYADQEQTIRTRWASASLEEDKGALITVRTLCHELNKHAAVPQWLKLKAGLIIDQGKLFEAQQRQTAQATMEVYRGRIAEIDDINALHPMLALQIQSDSALLESHRDLLIREIAKKTGFSATSIRKDIKAAHYDRVSQAVEEAEFDAMTGASCPLDSSQVDLNIAFSLLEDISSECAGTYPIFTRYQWHLWKGTHWNSSTGKAVVERKAVKAIQKHGVQVTSARVKGVVDIARVHIQHDDALFEPDEDEIAIYTPNVALKFNKVLYKWYPTEHKPQNRNLSVIATSYDERAPEPSVFLNFMNEVMTSEHAIRSFAVMMIYAAVTCRPWLRKCAFLYGPPRTGKSKALDFLEAMLGKHNCSSISLQQLGSKNGPHALVGKLANISNEALSKKAFEDAIFRALISGEPITVEQKYHDPFSFRNRATMLFALNEFPRVTDTSGAVWDRAVLYHMPRQIPVNRMDYDLGRKLESEKVQVLNWAMKIFAEEYAKDECRGIMTPDEDGLREMDKWRTTNNNALQWAEERLEYSDFAEDRVLMTSAYDDYALWCKKYGHMKCSHNSFSRSIASRYPTVKPGNKREISRVKLTTFGY